MFCTQCGSKNEDGTKFCTQCGTPLEQAVQETEVLKEMPAQATVAMPQATTAMPAAVAPSAPAPAMPQATTAMPVAHSASAPAPVPSAPAPAPASAPFATAPVPSAPATAPANYAAPADPYAAAGAPQASGSNIKLPIIIGAAAVLVIALVVLAVFLVPGLTGPKDTGPNVQNSQVADNVNKSDHTVVFETNGGTTYEPTKVKAGDVLTSPVDPERPGYTFGGWYLDSGCTQSIGFPYTVKQDDPENIIIFAKWNEANEAAQSQPTSTDLLPHSSSDYITDSDVAGFNKDQIQRAINEIYARHGYIFQTSQTEKQYFESQPWYRGTETSMDKVRAQFNQYELENEKKLAEIRARMG